MSVGKFDLERELLPRSTEKGFKEMSVFAVLSLMMTFVAPPITAGEEQRLLSIKSFQDPKSVSIKSECHVKAGVKKRSQHREDEIVFDKFYANPPKCGGTILEIGGFDGKKLSNSWFFEHALDWQTVLIEAFPQNFEKMVKNRPNAINVFGAICLTESVEFSVGKHPATGGSTSDMSSYHKEKFTNDETGAITVPCKTIEGVLTEYSITHIDVFFLDVEGAELSVLQTIDWSKVNIDMFVVEMNDTNPMKDEAVRAMLKAQGYVQPFSLREECRQRKGQQCVNNEVHVLPDLISHMPGASS